MCSTVRGVLSAFSVVCAEIDGQLEGRVRSSLSESVLKPSSKTMATSDTTAAVGTTCSPLSLSLFLFLGYPDRSRVLGTSALCRSITQCVVLVQTESSAVVDAQVNCKLIRLPPAASAGDWAVSVVVVVVAVVVVLVAVVGCCCFGCWSCCRQQPVELN